MADFSGSDFKALDDDLVGDGTTDTTQPLDTIDEHFLLNNERQTGQEGARVTLSPYANRKVASAEGAIFHMLPYWINPGLQTLRVGIGGRRKGETGSEDLTLSAQLFRLGRSAESTTTPPSTETARKYDRIEISLGGNDIAQPKRDVLLLRVEGEIGNSNNGSEDAYADNVPESQYIFGSDIHVPESYSAYTKVVDNAVISGSSNPSTDGDPHDVVFDGANSGDALGSNVALRVSVLGQGSAITDQIKGNDLFVGDYVAFWYVPYLTFDALWIEEEYEDTSQIEDGSASDTRSPIAAKRTYDAAQSSQLHGETIQESQDRLRPILIGYEGLDRPDPDTASDWPTDIPERWAYGIGDGGTTTLLQEGSAFLDTIDPVIRFSLVFLPVIDRPTTPSDRQSVIDNARSGTWDLTVRAEQLTSSSNTWLSPNSLGSTTETIDVNHYKTATNGVFPSLLTIHHLLNSDSTNDDTTTLGWAWKEGHLYNGDLTLLQFEKVDLSVTTAEPDLPIRLQLDCSYNDDGPPNSLTYLVMVGISAWEVPQ